MNKETLKSLWVLFGVIIWMLLFTKAFYDWTQGIQPDNFTVMSILLMTIFLEGEFRGRG